VTDLLCPTRETQVDLRAVYDEPPAAALAKDIGHIDQHCRWFIELSPFLCMGTMGLDGLGDVSPRGGEPGFVHVLDRNLLAMPDRPGNNRIDSLSNIAERPGVGLLFFIPGFGDVLRVNGLARIATDRPLMDRFIVNGKAPLSVILIDVKEAYLHCPKAIKRARLWDPDVQVERSLHPSAGQIYRDQLNMEKEASAIDAVLDKRTQETLY